ncbi:MAG: hypothetical protein CYG61_10460 [Actinobacteria bacterium]|nr:MAG: hypothetical protein CYG61_10460 [Actinomycetota bacterium]
MRSAFRSWRPASETMRELPPDHGVRLHRQPAGQLDPGTLQEWRHGRLPLRREWHLVGRAGGELVPTARLMLENLGTEGD